MWRLFRCLLFSVQLANVWLVLSVDPPHHIGLQGASWLHSLHDKAKIESRQFPHHAALWIAEETALGTVVGAVSASPQLASAALTRIMIGIVVLNANDTDRRLAGMQAIGYAITAGAFDDPNSAIPLRPEGEQRVLPRQANSAQARAGLERGLRCHGAQSGGEGGKEKRGRSKQSCRLFWRGVGKGERRIWSGF
jgi:hypothetical protein